MNILIKIAWKNIWAYKKRSIVTIVLILLTTGLMIFSSAFMEGSHNTMIKSGVEIYPGYIQITQKDYRSSPGLENLIFDVNKVSSILSQLQSVHTTGIRFETFVLYSKDEKAVAGLFTGIEPDNEKMLSRLAESITTGKYLSNSADSHVYMGIELAKKLDLKVGDIVSFIGTGADYSFTADNLKVIGLFKTGLFDFDANGAFVSKQYMDTIMATHNIGSYFVVRPVDLSLSFQTSIEINSRLGQEYTAEDWTVRLSGLVQAMKVDSIFGYITLGIIFLVIFFVVMIYTYLSVFTRVKEVGVLRAIGTTPVQVLISFLLESILLSFAAVTLGAILGGAVVYYFQIHPLDYSGYEEQFKQYGLAASAMPAHFSIPLILRDSLIMFILSVTSTLYPIIKIIGFKPVEAIKHV